MKDETKQWLKYANENLESSKILLESFLFNPSLQNAQQSIEKNICLKCIEIASQVKEDIENCLMRIF